MSAFIHVVNKIKTSRNETWLTPSQQVALKAIKKSLRVPGTVNLWGSTGVGKTFLAWVLADEMNFAYFPHLSCFVQAEISESQGVILDNCRPERMFHRETLKELGLLGVHRTVLITRRLVQDYTRYVELSLTPEDISHVRSSMIGIGIMPSQVIEIPHLWYLINPYLGSVKEGSDA